MQEISPKQNWQWSWATAVLLLSVAGGLYLVPVVWGRTLTGHESVQPQTSREMLSSGHWLIPTIGGDVWLERPPPPMWWIGIVYTVTGVKASDSIARLAAVLAALPIILLTVGIAKRLFGKGVAVMAGLILATMHEFYSYAINPEADIFLCLIVTAVLALFVSMEFPHVRTTGAVAGSGKPSFFGTRPWPMAGFFLLLGATNWAKGLLFGTVMAAAPIVLYLLGRALQERSFHPLRPYLWCWGWLIAGAAALAWPVAVIGQYPEILQLWQEHYLGRLHRGYLREPWWYYAVQVPYVLLPWTLPALVGLLCSARAAWQHAGRERFICCWALSAPLLLSLADGKHHHYLLHCLGGWAILAAVGLAPLWGWLQDKLRLIPYSAALGAVAMALLAGTGGILWYSRIPGRWGTIVGAVVFISLATWVILTACQQRHLLRAFVGILAPILAAYWLWVPYQASYLDDYKEDLVFLRGAESLIPNDVPVLVQYDWTAPLETFWVLYHMRRPGVLIRDPWQAAEKTANGGQNSSTAYVLARRLDLPLYRRAGTVETVLESTRTRGEKNPDQRRVLYRIHFTQPLPPAPEDYLRVVRRTLW
ncbi:MAG: glycosyltransferase family 39 protein [Gemmataceae bacterium]|uniref:Glycosyltransferase family 39 protein n=1 Tax=Thermogemmata fonticola TaxID=2755323 RepID=A0A7V8VEE1_9BACT|nr:glycosyltransferase family 39 protein [Thermogemmata fonticola]MBA2226330.1 glycosyltransferase family 39 protein [Thermogemmata fonticola]MCX8139988.1 glycosyltransferase family 39 protein [Gemmataceae bacterium]